jgi:mannanase-like protein
MTVHKGPPPSPACWERAALLVAATRLLPGCGWDQLDAIGAAPDALDAQSQPAATDSEAFDASAALEGSSPAGGISPSACSSAQLQVRQWTFDSNAEGWTVFSNTGVQPSLTWTRNTGNPSPGALQVDFAPSSPSGAWLRYLAPLGNLVGRTISAWVWLETGASPRLKVFVQTGQTYAWADYGIVYLSPHVWTCVSMVVSSPVYTGPNYDPTNVIVVGFEMLASSPFRLYVDTVRY